MPVETKADQKRTKTMELRGSTQRPRRLVDILIAAWFAFDLFLRREPGSEEALKSVPAVADFALSFGL